MDSDCPDKDVLERLGRIEERLNAGAETFVALRNDVEALHKWKNDDARRQIADLEKRAVKTEILETQGASRGAEIGALGREIGSVQRSVDVLKNEVQRSDDALKNEVANLQKDHAEGMVALWGKPDESRKGGVVGGLGGLLEEVRFAKRSVKVAWILFGLVGLDRLIAIAKTLLISKP